MTTDDANNFNADIHRQVVTGESIGGEQAARPHHMDALTRRARNKRIIEDVCAITGVAYRELMGRSRYHKVVDARHLAIALIAKANPDYSYPRIGKIFQRDHTTVMFAVQRHGKTRKDGKPFAKFQGPSRALEKGVFKSTEGETTHETA